MCKHLLILASLLASCIHAIAQPVFTSADNPQVGDSFTYYNCTAATPGAAGPNVTWNFSTVTSTSNYGAKYDLCSSAPNCSIFSGSTNIEAIPSQHFTDFLILDANHYAINGIYGNSNAYIYTDPMDILRYPVNYNDSFIDSFASHFTISPYNYLERGHNHFTADAWGTLILPTGTFTNTLRFHSVEVYTDSVLNTTPSVTKDSIDNYSWQAPGYREYLFSIVKVFQNGNLISSTYSYTGQLPASVTKTNQAITSFDTYPNPVKDELHIQFNLTESQTVRLSLIDFVGKEIAVINDGNLAAGHQQIDFNMPPLAHGMYLINIRTEAANITKKIEVW